MTRKKAQRKCSSKSNFYCAHAHAQNVHYLPRASATQLLAAGVALAVLAAQRWYTSAYDEQLAEWCALILCTLLAALWQVVNIC